MTLNPKTKVQTIVSQIAISSQQVDVQKTLKNLEQGIRSREITNKYSIHY